MNKSAYLAGPFIGELDWELYRFAPYAIHLKRENPNAKLIVYTRPTRFDLYGSYADILVPLNLKYEKQYEQHCFGLFGFDNKDYDLLKDFYYKKYAKRYEIEDHIVPDVCIWRKKIKWQFSRSEMDYNFRPRKQNEKILDGLFDSTNSVFVSSGDSDIRRSLSNMGYDPIMQHWLIDVVKNNGTNLETSFVGCLIVLIKKCRFVVSNVNSLSAKIALLLGVPVISINEKMKYDSVRLLNPFNVPVINCYEIEEGVDIYEDNF